MATFTEEIEAYDRMRDRLETEHPSKWVVIHGGKREGLYDSFEEAADDAVRRFGRGPYLIREVCAGPIAIPASALYHPVRA